MPYLLKNWANYNWVQSFWGYFWWFLRSGARDLVIYHNILRRLLLSIPLMSMVVVTHLRRLRSFPQIWQLSDHPIRFHLRRLSLLEASDVILELLALCQTDSSHATDRVDDRPQKQETIRIKTKVCVLAIMINSMSAAFSKWRCMKERKIHDISYIDIKDIC